MFPLFLYYVPLLTQTVLCAAFLDHKVAQENQRTRANMNDYRTSSAATHSTTKILSILTSGCDILMHESAKVGEWENSRNDVNMPSPSMDKMVATDAIDASFEGIMCPLYTTVESSRHTPLQLG